MLEKKESGVSKAVVMKEDVGDVVAISDSTAIIQVIERAASDPNTDIEKMERLLAMHERILEKNAEQAYTQAMMGAQAEMKPIATDEKNAQTHSEYTSYKALDQALRPIYTKHGFSLSFDTGDGAPENHVRVLCYVGHVSGHTRTYRADIPADGKGAKGGDVMTKTHAAGSAFTYGQRYLIKLIFNVAIGEYDDDGNTACESITADQKNQILAGLKETESDTKGFLKFMGVDNVDAIPSSAFNRAMNAINAKRGKK